MAYQGPHPTSNSRCVTPMLGDADGDGPPKRIDPPSEEVLKQRKLRREQEKLSSDPTSAEVIDVDAYLNEYGEYASITTTRKSRPFSSSVMHDIQNAVTAVPAKELPPPPKAPRGQRPRGSASESDEDSPLAPTSKQPSKRLKRNPLPSSHDGEKDTEQIDESESDDEHTQTPVREAGKKPTAPATENSLSKRVNELSKRVRAVPAPKPTLPTSAVPTPKPPLPQVTPEPTRPQIDPKTTGSQAATKFNAPRPSDKKVISDTPVINSTDTIPEGHTYTVERAIMEYHKVKFLKDVFHGYTLVFERGTSKTMVPVFQKNGSLIPEFAVKLRDNEYPRVQKKTNSELIEFAQNIDGYEFPGGTIELIPQLKDYTDHVVRWSSFGCLFLMSKLVKAYKEGETADSAKCIQLAIFRKDDKEDAIDLMWAFGKKSAPKESHIFSVVWQKNTMGVINKVPK